MRICVLSFDCGRGRDGPPEGLHRRVLSLSPAGEAPVVSPPSSSVLLLAHTALRALRAVHRLPQRAWHDIFDHDTTVADSIKIRLASLRRALHVIDYLYYLLGY